MKVLICWSGISGYLAACWRALAARPGVELEVITFPMLSRTSAPFLHGVTAGLRCTHVDESRLADVAYVRGLAAAARPDVAVLCGWATPAYLRLPFCPELAGCRFAMAMDTPWVDSLRQRLARLRLSRYLGRMDRVIVPGERGWQYARRLGFTERQIARGVYGYDDAPLAPLLARRTGAAGGWPRRFLYVGRYVKDKGIDVLLEGYGRYRAAAIDPWPLTCCGTGPLADAVGRAAGVEDRGFVQPPDQPEIFAGHGAFVMASRYEPWGVALAEACAAGLPVVCTEACGASVELVRSCHNGLTVATNDPAALADGLAWVDGNYDRLSEMGARGRAMATAYAAERWAERWERVLRELVAG